MTNSSQIFSVQDILSCTGGQVENAADLVVPLQEVGVTGPAPLGASSKTDLAFFFSRAYEKELPLGKPGILITGRPFVGPLKAAGLPLWKSSVVISCPDPYFAMAQLSEKFAGVSSSVAHLPRDPGAKPVAKSVTVHSTAIVAESVQLGEGVSIGPHCVIEEGVSIGKGTHLYPGCVVGPRCVIGEDCVLFPGVTLYEWTSVGNRVRLHAGVVLGSDGFGYAPRKEGARVSGHQKIYHLGRVVLEDDVEIGANSCVDRGTFGETRIGKNSKLDNLVHIGHNSRLGEGAIICGGTCLAGNASVGKYAYVGGLTGIGNHVHVGDGASVGALSMVTKDVPVRGTAVGNPQREYREHFRAHAFLSKQIRKPSKEVE